MASARREVAARQPSELFHSQARAHGMKINAMSEQHPPPSDGHYVTAMSHFYRGEVGRIMAWRARLDNTTNWAITTTSTIFTVAFSIERVPHIIFLFNVAVVGIMLWIEARRYRFYDAFRARVRMLEAHFLVPVVMQHAPMLEGDWRKLLAEDLLMPGFKISRFEALGRSAEAKLRLHLHHHPRRLDHKDLPPRAAEDHRLAFILPRTQRQQCVPRLARGVFPFLHAQHRARNLLLGRAASARRIHRLRPAAELEDLESRRAGLPRGLARGARCSVLSAQFSERIGHAI